ncbi:extracellular solute-binding protein [Streptomyces phaeochromogenes]|uniref:ABC transporter substrate-binding protein n=1 Tax=Streptomyces phaeochromogenes TaxID=1923 RepID=UPI00225B2858|nr:ABC transporter substrate-binding protein [Streptomyces phaeochromogenes]MCX5599369.1 extracellular solute-binding protein [Streptomyces phaeochromogenes]
MSSNISRRSILAVGAGATVAAATGAATANAAEHARGDRSGAGSSSGVFVREETRSLDQLYQAALAEGGKLVVYAGGDVDDQLAGVRAGFRSRFPDIDLTIVVDYSKFHDVRIDNQLATDTLVPDVVQLQTLQDFTRWARQGELLSYKPAGFSAVHPKFKDPGGAWTAVMAVAFSFVYNVAAVGADVPRTPLDFVDPRWKGAIASSYPHDDDAVLYLFSLYVRKYGWEWVAKFAAQQPQFARGSHKAGVAVGAGQKSIGVGSSGSLLATGGASRWALPTEGHPFMAWGQRAAILKQGAHPTAAKLYLNWMLSPEVQGSSFSGWSVRTDIPLKSGLKPIWEYKDANLDGFPVFMEDRARIEQLKQTFALYFGEVQGAPSPGVLGLHPGR